MSSGSPDIGVIASISFPIDDIRRSVAEARTAITQELAQIPGVVIPIVPDTSGILPAIQSAISQSPGVVVPVLADTSMIGPSVQTAVASASMGGAMAGSMAAGSPSGVTQAQLDRARQQEEGGGGGLGGGMLLRMAAMRLAMEGVRGDIESIGSSRDVNRLSGDIYGEGWFNGAEEGEGGDSRKIARRTLEAEKRGMSGFTGVGHDIHDMILQERKLRKAGVDPLGAMFLAPITFTSESDRISNAENDIDDANEKDARAEARREKKERLHQFGDHLSRQSSLTNTDDVDRDKISEEYKERNKAADDLKGMEGNTQRVQQMRADAEKLANTAYQKIDIQEGRAGAEFQGEAQSANLRAAGDATGAARQDMLTRQTNERAGLVDKYGEATAPVTNFDKAAAAERAEFEKNAAKEKEANAADSARRIADIQGEARDATLRANGQGNEADLDSFKRAGDDKVKSLRDQAAASKDAAEATRLNAEADAQAAANAQEYAARLQELAKAQRERSAESRARAGISGMQAQGETSAANEAQFAENQRAAMQRLLNDPHHTQEDAENLQRDQAGDRAVHQYTRQQTFQNSDVQAGRLNAQASGQGAMADVFDLRQKIQDELAAANGDPEAMKHARGLIAAQIRGEEHSLTSGPGGFRDTNAYVHALTGGGSGDGRAEALKAVQDLQHNIAAGKGIGQLDPQAFNAAVEKFDASMNKLPTIAVVRY